MTKTRLTYKDAGVDIDAGNELVAKLRPIVAKTHRPEVLASIGGFGSLFALDRERYPDPVLVSGTDGVGTKLLLARDLDAHERIGIDLVAMCVNDVIAQGAEPLFFLDYFACGELNVGQAEAVVSGIAAGCTMAGCALIGGETAEMPGMYAAGHYDLAGFCVGVVNRDAIIDGHNIEIGDTLIGLGSSGPHSNGYSLVRRIVADSAAPLETDLGNGILLGDALIEPTRIYAPALAALQRAVDVRGIAHITGGGLIENAPRMCPDHLKPEIDYDQWETPPVFDWLQSIGNIDAREMRRTFNMGIGMVIAVPEDRAQDALDVLNDANEAVSVIGTLSDT
ncbi:MAG: phosphoribosylformylglycinamidine cyclo-ligase [Pseudomonadota bacterium]